MIAELRSDRNYPRCVCPINAEGIIRIDGFIRKATGEVKWPKAEELKKKCEDAGTVDLRPPDPAPQQLSMVKHVVEQFTNDRVALKTLPSTLRTIVSSLTC